MFLAVVRFPYEISCLFALIPNTRLFQNSRGWGLVARREVMQRHACESEFGGRGGVGGEYVEKG
jgi:hypothetical protein